MVVFMHRDVVPGGAARTDNVETTTLQPEATLAQGQITNPRGMTIDGQGNIYIADAGNHRIVVLSPSGDILRTVGSFGNGPGQLYEPSGVGVDAAGNMYVADTWNSRIAKFGPDGTFIKSWGTSNAAFDDPVVDPQTGQSAQRFATDNKGDAAANAANPLGFFGPRNVLVNGDRVYIADTGNTRIVVTDLDGNFVQQWGSKGDASGQLREPIGLGIDEAGRLFVGDTWNGRVQVFQTANGSVDAAPLTAFRVSGWAANTYNDPYIAVTPDGRVWASQGARNTIAEYDAAQQLVRRIASQPPFAAPKGLALSPDGALYVVNSNQQQVLRFKP
jgi:sugar lactone lactonase YvrE